MGFDNHNLKIKIIMKMYFQADFIWKNRPIYNMAVRNSFDNSLILTKTILRSLSFNFGFSLFDDHQVKDGKIVVDDATSDGFSLSLSGTAWTIALLSFLEEELNSTNWGNTLKFMLIMFPGAILLL